MWNNKSKSLLIALSLFVSILIWFLANATTEITISVEDVPVEFLNEETALAEKGFMLVRGKDAAVDLRLTMTRGTVFRMDPDKIRLIADLSSVSSTGTQNISCRIDYPGKISSADVRIESPSILAVPVEIGELFSKQVEIRCILNGNVADGYLAGAVRLLPETLEVRGQQIDIMQVNYAQVELDIDEAKSTIVALKDFTLYDFSDQPIDSDRIHPVSDQIQVTLPVMGVKEVPLTVEFVETPGARLHSVEWDLDVDSITLCGDDAILNTLTEIKLDTLALEDLRVAESRSYELIVPEGLYNLSGVESVTLTVESNDIVTQSYLVSAFDYQNLNYEQEVTVITTTRPVTLRGNRADLAELSSEDLVAIVDLSELSGVDGLYTLPASIRTSTGADVGVVGTLEVAVRLESIA